MLVLNLKAVGESLEKEKLKRKKLKKSHLLQLSNLKWM
jgi:hypothetical protein